MNYGPVHPLSPPDYTPAPLERRVVRQFMLQEGLLDRYITNIGGIVVSLPVLAEIPIHPGQRPFPSYLGSTG